jgi:hypothetical protein
MSGDEIGVEMGQEYLLDLKTVLGGKGDVLVRIALRVNDGSRAGLLVFNNVRGVRQARQIELLEDHARTPSGSGTTSAGEQSEGMAWGTSSRRDTFVSLLPPARTGG